MGILGWVMKQYGWPRPAALIGYVLSDNLEIYLFISVQRYGFEWFTRTGVIILAAIIIGSLAMGVFYQARKSSKAKASGERHAK
jgi:TctA family transporter